MSQHYAAYYGSGLRLNKKEFDSFLARYLDVNGVTKKDIVKRVYQDDDIEDSEIEEMFESLIEANDMEFIWSSDLSVTSREKCVFESVYVSLDNCEGMDFHQYYSNGKPNVYFTNVETSEKNPDYVDSYPVHEESYMFFSDHALDSPLAFEKRPYSSYGEFKQEFKNKMEAYLPDDFDWDAHIGLFTYACFG